MRVVTSSRIICALLPHISDDETRMVINGIGVKPAPEGMKGIILTATNGHTIVTLHDENGTTDAAGIMHVKSSEEMVEHLEDAFSTFDTFDEEEEWTSRHQKSGVFLFADGKVNIFDPKLLEKIQATFTLEKNEFEFVKFERVFQMFPFKSPQEWLCINPELLEKLGQTFMVLKGSVTPHIKLYFPKAPKDRDGGYDASILVRGFGLPHVYGQIMPVRDGGFDSEEIPSWLLSK